MSGEEDDRPSTTDTLQSLPVFVGLHNLRRSERIRGQSELVGSMDGLVRCMEQLAETQRRQLELLEQRPVADGGQPRRGNDSINLAPYREEEDIQDFLAAFERAMGLQRIDEEEWPAQLLKVLTGKARSALVEVDPEAGYVEVKEVLLGRFAITPEASRIRLRQLRLEAAQDPGDVLAKVKRLVHRWLIPPGPEPDEDAKAREDRIVDQVAKEQLLNMLPRQTREWLIQQDLRTPQEIVQRLREYRLIQKEGPAAPSTMKRAASQETTLRNDPSSAMGPYRSSSKLGVPQERSRTPISTSVASLTRKDSVREKTCYKCGQKGHLMRNCREEAFGCLQEVEQPCRGMYTCTGKVEGLTVQDIRLDTQCSRTVVRRNLVSNDKLKKETIDLRVASGEKVTFPLADVQIEVDDVAYNLVVAVAENLPADVLLGQDVDLGRHLWKRMPIQEKDPIVSQILSNQQSDSAMVLTRSQVKASQQKEEEEEPHTTEDVLPSDCPISTPDLLTAQANDEEIQRWKNQVGPERVTLTDNGVLFRRWKPHGDDGIEYRQLVLPKSYRSKVLQLGHELPIAGHLGRRKTTKRILQRFYWPTIHNDIAEYVKGCPTCQKTERRGKKRAPLQPLPIQGEPFQRIAMDIIGPLPKTRRGHEYILVICDYATRYPVAIPLKRFTAVEVAEQLVDTFAQYGIPKEILTDQGTNFTSKLLAELYGLLGVRALKTAPYHPQTDGLVERFNQTLKNMLRRVLVEDKRDWDRLLPYVLFAYREVPQASTGFSPFELVYGRDVRGPLDVLQEEWASPKTESDSIVEYVLKVKTRLELAKEMVERNMTEAQEDQRKWYDKKARETQLQPGDKVLVLLPTSNHSLFAQWQGPYLVRRALGKVNYEVVIPERRRPHVVFHVNLLRKWEERRAEMDETAMLMEEGDDASVSEEFPDWKPTEDTPLLQQLGPGLDTQQQDEMLKVLKEFPDTLSKEPGKTKLIEHHIHTTSDRPIRQQPYRLPKAYQEEVEAELQAMEEAGIIEPSRSEWAFPIVVVRKKSGDIRICIDYRKLNKVTQGDAYPMPRIDDILDSLGQAKYLTTLDLAKGYWQVPVDPKDRVKTAFVSPRGLYQFKVMPFGLCGAPATFQRLMDRVTKDLNYVNAYLDDLVIFSETWTDHLDHVVTTLKRLREAGLTINLKKCRFGAQECTYLGHKIGNGTTRPESAKVEEIARYPVPTTKKGVRTYLGLTGYYRRFIANYSTIAKPLTDLTKKACPEKIEWTTDCQDAFDHLKQALVSQPVMRNPDFRRDFIVQTDASGCGVGAVLSQPDEEGNDHPIAYFSKKLLPREQKYSTVEQECLAIKLAIEAFSVYLLGRPFKVQTDHRALRWLDKAKDTNARLTRWSIALQPYQFTVEHRQGRANGNADALSRIPAEECCAPNKEGENVRISSDLEDHFTSWQLSSNQVGADDGAHVSSTQYLKSHPRPEEQQPPE